MASLVIATTMVVVIILIMIMKGITMKSHPERFSLALLLTLFYAVPLTLSCCCTAGA
jgi:hypothetical protein